MTNVDDVFADITAKGQHPRIYSDTYILLEQVGHRLDRESERLYKEAVEAGLEGMDVTHYIEQHIDVSGMGRRICALRSYRKRGDVQHAGPLGHTARILVSR